MACCSTKTKYRSNSGTCFYSATGTVSTTAVIETVNTKLCTLMNVGMFGVYMPIVGTGALPVSLATCCGAVAALYDPTTGAQVTAAQLFAGTTYVVTYDTFSGKFFVQTPLVAAA